MEASFEHEVPVRYRDLDTYGHVNNVVYGTYCEEARVAYVEEVLELDELDEFTAVVASLELDFRSSVTELTAVDVGVSVVRMGESSFTMAYEIRQDGELVAEAETTQVFVDPETRESRPVPDAWRERVREFEGLDD
ncbi:acyl-CoA thioesterase [Halosimplex litoreum]|uniref:Acyl-CoA thioesterase n=1 Tax=Halosimplex litoreum TaxID=1198301 RepID=A0A7T3FXF7_9EURY|nr:thioesterase family protein [Halosimplex litoreum]QPV62470.1 acyl-CoA thioesterase [Halosimplex litoreum]